MTKHILISGARGVGKSTLIERLLAENFLPLHGFITKRLETADAKGFYPIHIYPLGAKWTHAEGQYWQLPAERNLLGTCDSKTHNVNRHVFNELGVQYIESAEPGGLIIMDELGFMEARAEDFKKAVFNELNGDIPVIAAVKNRTDVDFLNDLRTHENVVVHNIDESNRDALYSELLPIIREWNAKYRIK